MLPFPVLNKYGNIAPAAPKIKKVQVGQNNASPYTGSLGINSTTNALNYTLCPLPSGVSDLSTVRIYHCNNRTYMWDGSNIYSSCQDQTYSTAVASNIYILDTPSN